jgi:hypothetical protein
MSEPQHARQELETRIQRDRDELRQALDLVRIRAREQLDPRWRVRERPIPWLAGAFCVGLWLGARG